MVVIYRRLRDEAYESQCIYGPEIVVAHRIPESLWSNGLAVVHVALARVVSENAVDDNGKFSVGEPAFGTEPSLSLYC